jgi:hypothetical protein
MDNLVKKDLLDSILQLREDVDRELKANKYYIALQKLDELLAAIRPLGTIEPTVSPSPHAEAAPAAEISSEPVAAKPEAPEVPAAAAQDEGEKVWMGVVEKAVVDQGWQPPAAEVPAEEHRTS